MNVPAMNLPGQDTACRNGAARDLQCAVVLRAVLERATVVTDADKRDLARRYGVSPYTDLDGLILEILQRWSGR